MNVFTDIIFIKQMPTFFFFFPPVPPLFLGKRSPPRSVLIPCIWKNTPLSYAVHKGIPGHWVLGLRIPSCLYRQEALSGIGPSHPGTYSARRRPEAPRRFLGSVTIGACLWIMTSGYYGRMHPTMPPPPMRGPALAWPFWGPLRSWSSALAPSFWALRTIHSVARRDTTPAASRMKIILLWIIPGQR